MRERQSTTSPEEILEILAYYRERSRLRQARFRRWSRRRHAAGLVAGGLILLALLLFDVLIWGGFAHLGLIAAPDGATTGGAHHVSTWEQSPIVRVWAAVGAAVVALGVAVALLRPRTSPFVKLDLPSAAGAGDEPPAHHAT